MPSLQTLARWLLTNLHLFKTNFGVFATTTTMLKLSGLVALLYLAHCCQSMSLTSYDGFKVLRVKVPDRSAADRLHAIADSSAEFWSDLPGRHADLMISPTEMSEMLEKLNGFEFSTMIENVAGIVDCINSFCLKLLHLCHISVLTISK